MYSCIAQCKPVGTSVSIVLKFAQKVLIVLIKKQSGIKNKARCGIICGILELVAGTSIGICASLFAAHIKYEYDHPYKNQRTLLINTLQNYNL